MKRSIEIHDDEGEVIELPKVWEICGHCRGSGKSSAYLGSFTSDEWAHEDEDFKEDYVRGAYDRSCDDCDGSGKIEIVDYDKLKPEQKEKYDNACKEEAAYRAEVEMERRMGC